MTAQLITPAEAGKRLDKHPKTVLELIHTGQLKAVSNGKSGPGARYKVVASSVDAYVRSHTYHPEI